MTKKQALQILREPDRSGVHFINANDPETTEYNKESLEAYALALKSLENDARYEDNESYERVDRRLGSWLHISIDSGTAERICSVCRKPEPYKFADIDTDIFEFCPHCGARLVKDK